MPLGDGHLFLPVKAEIRKKIKKEAGDTAHVILFKDEEPFITPIEVLDCLREEPAAIRFFELLNDREQQHYVKWIYAAKQENIKANRIVKTIEGLLQQKKLHEL